MHRSFTIVKIFYARWRMRTTATVNVWTPFIPQEIIETKLKFGM